MSNSHVEHIARVGGTRLIQDYISGNETLKEFVGDFPSEESILKVAENRSFSVEDRRVLHESVKVQYEMAGVAVPESWESIKSEYTFTITTGHQLNLFGGPKYFIYKIISIIKLSQTLNKQQKKFNFLPVFWMATEDHDFDEINHVEVFEHSIKSADSLTGPVGRHSPSVFDEAFGELKKVLGASKEAEELIRLFEEAYAKLNWSDFTRFWVDSLFNGKVVIVDGDDASLKKLFIPTVQRELKEQVTDKCVSIANEKLESFGYHVQVSHRAVNLFYIEDGIRERIGELNGQHKVHNLSKCIEESDVDNHPESMSPNALLRPVYQETILPNVAYIGGPGELAYWFQLKGLFRELRVSFPILVLRDSFLFIKERDQALLGDLGLSLEDLSGGEDDLVRSYISKNELKAVDFDTERKDLIEIIEKLKVKISKLHRDYHPMLEAEKTRVEKFIDKLELRAFRDAKFREEVNLNKIKDLREKYFPGGALVERKSSFMEEYLQLGKETYFNRLFDASNVMDSRIKVIAVNK